MRQARVRQGSSIGALLITPDQDVFYIASTVPHSVLDYLNHKQQKNDAFINQLETLAVAVDAGRWCRPAASRQGNRTHDDTRGAACATATPLLERRTGSWLCRRRGR